MRGRGLLPSLSLLAAAGDGARADVFLDAALALSGAQPLALLEELLAECGAPIAAACEPRVRALQKHYTCQCCVYDPLVHAA